MKYVRRLFLVILTPLLFIVFCCTQILIILLGLSEALRDEVLCLPDEVKNWFKVIKNSWWDSRY